MGKFSGDVCIFKNNGDPLANMTTGYDEHDIRKRWREENAIANLQYKNLFITMWTIVVFTRDWWPG